MLVFLFQAEDGIRDLVRSRGLGDVYKRQSHALQDLWTKKQTDWLVEHQAALEANEATVTAKPVSYTHLTLPTSDLV